jgi:hypothetical protein
MKKHLFGVVLAALLLIACGESGSSASPAQLAPTQPALASINPPTIPASAIARPTAWWEPPAPPPYTPVPITPTPSIAMITYQVAEIGTSDELQITPAGEARLISASGPPVTSQLSSEQLSQLKAAFEAIHFFDLNERYREVDPSGVIREMAIRTITYQRDGRAKSVQLRGVGQIPPALSELEQTLKDIAVDLQKIAARGPQPLISYYLDTGQVRYFMDIDSAGDVYFGDRHVGRLTPDQLHKLTDLFLASHFSELEAWYTAPDEVRDITREQRAIVAFTWRGQHKEVNALSGANVPQAVATILARLAEIYGQFQPGQ